MSSPYSSTIAVFSLHTCPLAAAEGKETGGQNVYVLELGKELGKLGFKVDMFTRSQDRHQPKIVDVAYNVRVVHLVCGPEKPLPKKKLIGFVGEFVVNFLKYSNEQKRRYDLIHAHYYLSGLAGLEVQKASKKHLPLVVNFHTLALMKNLVARTQNEAENKFRINAEQKLIFRSDHIIASSQTDKQYLRFLYNCPPHKISVVTPGVDTSVFHPYPKTFAKKAIGTHTRHKIILAAGRMEPLKGYDVLLYALKILLVRHPRLKDKVNLWLVGGDVSEKPNLWAKELKKLERVRTQLDIKAAVRFAGYQPQSRLPYFYSAADIVVMPSHYESFGMTALEAIACGTPVIATNVTGVASIVTPSVGIVTSANNPLLLAQHIERLLKRKKSVSPNISNRMENYSWAKAAIKTAAIYRRLITV